MRKRSLAIAIAIALALDVALGAPAFATPTENVVNLDRPGVLESLARDNPAHYAKIVKVLDAAQVKPCETLPGLLRAQVRVEDVNCASHLYLTSMPPKIHLGFRIDDIRYTSNVAQPGVIGRIVPAHANARPSHR